jgi:glycerophosphoryl diester phosphodiesterase
MMPNRLAILCFALACGWTALPAGAAAPLELIGQQILPTGFIPSGDAGGIGGTPVAVGGLSGIDFDPESGRYLAISDDRSQSGPARFYNLSLDLAAFKTGTTGGVTFNSVTTLLRPDGTPFPALTVDPEALRLRGGKVFWTSEGEANFGAGRVDSPFVRNASIDGTFSTQFASPAKYVPIFSVGGTQASGIRNNLAFESLSFDASGNRLYTATENALFQDGPAASVSTGSPSRVLAFDSGTGAAVAEYVYVTEPVALPPDPAGAFATNGLVELLAVSDSQFLALERSFSVGAAGTPGNTGNTIRLFLASLDGASNVLGLDSLAGSRTRP